MKKTIILILLLCNRINAQTPIIPLSDRTVHDIAGAYYKDTQNKLNQFVGVWRYENTTTNTIFELHLFKKLINFNSFNYEDLIYGEYLYIENGVTKINTIANLNTVLPDVTHYNVRGGEFLIDNTDSPICTDCTIGQKRIKLSLGDPVKDIMHTLRLKILNTTPPTMRLHNTSDGITYPSNANTFDNFINGGVKVGVTIPLGWYDLVKQ
jgi:hypothetical protein